MRRGVWVVLVLIGGVSAGAPAQQKEREPSNRQARAQRQGSNEALQQQIAELWQALHQLQGEVARLREQAGEREQAPAVGGSGRTGGSTSQAGGSGQQSASGTAPLACRPRWSSPATGGSGMGSGSQAPAGQPAGQVFVGRVRSVTRDRLIMVGPSQRVYEFALGGQTRIIGPEGAASSLQSLKQGELVRAVTREAGVRNEVLSLEVIRTIQAP